MQVVCIIYLSIYIYDVKVIKSLTKSYILFTIGYMHFNKLGICLGKMKLGCSKFLYVLHFDNFSEWLDPEEVHLVLTFIQP